MLIISTILYISALLSGLNAQPTKSSSSARNEEKSPKPNYQNLYQKELETNQKLTEKITQITHKHNKQMLILGWQYDKLEKKAQNYYSHFQSNKNDVIKIKKKDPFTHEGEVDKNGLLPLLLSKVRAQRSKMRKEASNSKLVARSANRKNSKLGKKAFSNLTLKTAIGSSSSPIKSNNKQNGKFINISNWSKSKRRKILQAKAQNSRSKKMSKNSEDDLFARVDLKGDFKRAERVSGIR